MGVVQLYAEDGSQFVSENVHEKRLGETNHKIDEIHHEMGHKITEMYAVIKTLEGKITHLEEETVSRDPSFLMHVDEQTDSLCMLALSNTPHALEYIHNKTYRYCSKAVGVDGATIQYVPITEFDDNQVKRLYEKALGNNGLALQYIPEEARTPDLCQIAIDSNIRAIHYVPKKMPYAGVWRTAIYREPTYVKLLDPLDDELYNVMSNYAYSLNHEIYYLIHKPTMEMTIDYIKKISTNKWDHCKYYIPDELKTSKIVFMMILKQLGFWYHSE